MIRELVTHCTKILQQVKASLNIFTTVTMILHISSDVLKIKNHVNLVAV